MLIFLQVVQHYTFIKVFIQCFPPEWISCCTYLHHCFDTLPSVFKLPLAFTVQQNDCLSTFPISAVDYLFKVSGQDSHHLYYVEISHSKSHVSSSGSHDSDSGKADVHLFRLALAQHCCGDIFCPDPKNVKSFISCCLRDVFSLEPTACCCQCFFVG